MPECVTKTIEPLKEDPSKPKPKPATKPATPEEPLLRLRVSRLDA